MSRILLLIILIWILYLIVKRVSASLKQDQFTKKTNENEKMVLCAKCGCHVPISESVIVNELIVCKNSTCNNAA